jgi:hypothetical protein
VAEQGRTLPYGVDDLAEPPERAADLVAPREGA